MVYIVTTSSMLMLYRPMGMDEDQDFCTGTVLILCGGEVRINFSFATKYASSEQTRVPYSAAGAIPEWQNEGHDWE
uniref:Uncharacterized protein n=1 Tax=Arundo donax TaxID=35708 RepID=A0A0A9EBL5_ARUDO